MAVLKGDRKVVEVVDDSTPAGEVEVVPSALGATFAERRAARLRAEAKMVAAAENK